MAKKVVKKEAPKEVKKVELQEEAPVKFNATGKFEYVLEGDGFMLYSPIGQKLGFEKNEEKAKEMVKTFNKK